MSGSSNTVIYTLSEWVGGQAGGHPRQSLLAG